MAEKWFDNSFGIFAKLRPPPRSDLAQRSGTCRDNVSDQNESASTSNRVQTRKANDSIEVDVQKLKQDCCNLRKRLSEDQCPVQASSSNFSNDDETPGTNGAAQLNQQQTDMSKQIHSASSSSSNSCRLPPSKLAEEECKKKARQDEMNTRSIPAATFNYLETSNKRGIFGVPKDWERQTIRSLASITAKDRHLTVFAVVSYFFPPKETYGPDMAFHFGLVDPTLYKNNDRLQILCFQRYVKNMPLITKVGDIIKFPLRVSVYKGNLQGRTYDGPFPWMTFDGDGNAPIVPRYSTGYLPAPSFTEGDFKRVEDLKTWAVSVGISLCKSNLCLADLFNQEKLYFNLLCQVVHVDSEQSLLHVWDGTEPSLPDLLSKCSETFASETKWEDKVVGRCVKIWIFGHDLDSTCTAGQFIKITNLNFKLIEECNEHGCVAQIPILTLHEGTSFERGIKTLDDGNDDVKKMERRMAALPSPSLHEVQVPKNREITEPCVVHVNKRQKVDEEMILQAELQTAVGDAAGKCATTETTTSSSNGGHVFKKPLHPAVRNETKKATETLVNQAKTQDADGERVKSSVCDSSPVGKSATNPSCALSTIAEIKNTEIRNSNDRVKFHCRGTVHRFVPSEVVDWFNYACLSCRTRYKLDEINDMANDPDYSAVEKCKKCYATLSLVMFCLLIVHDPTGCLDVVLSDVVFSKLFSGVNPKKILTNETVRTLITRYFAILISHQVPVIMEVNLKFDHDGKVYYFATNLTR